MDALQNLDYPSNKENWIVDILIGGLIFMVPIFNFVALGYTIEAMEMGMRRLEILPTWENMGEKFMKGLLFFVISLVYVIPPILVAFVSLIPMIIELIQSGEPSGITIFLAVAGFVISLILAIFAGFIMPMGLARWVASGNIGAAFQMGQIFEDIKAVLADYLVAYLLMAFLGGAIMLVIGWIPFINMMVIFYWYVAFYNYFGKLYARVREKASVQSY